MKKVKITDLSVYLEKSIGKQMAERGLEVRGTLAIIFNKATGKAIVTGNEVVHDIYTLDEEMTVDLFKKNKVREDGSQAVSLMPEARLA